MNLRFFYTLAFFCLVPISPWWLPATLALLGMIFFRHYVEALVLLFFYDLVFGLPSGWLSTQFTMTVIFFVLFLLIEGYRDRLIFSQR